MSGHRIVTAGDAAIVLEFDAVIDPAVSARAAAVASSIEASHLRGVRDVVPAYRSVAVYFDPLESDRADVIRRLTDAAEGPPAAVRAAGQVLEVPVCYGGDFGPDLARVAAFGELSESQAIELHASVTYRVLMLGFMPGFAYLGTVDPRIAAPRLDVPRARVPRGSIGIAKAQTGVYPGDTPGGWQLIGRTPLRPFDLARREPFLFRVGDDVRFVPVSVAEFDRLDCAR